MSLATAAEQFHRTEELLAIMCQSLEPCHLRVLATTSKLNYNRFNNDGWRTLDGIGNLLVILDDTLGEPAQSAGMPHLQIPIMSDVEPARKARFMHLCNAIQHLNVFSNPDKWTRWRGWEHLLDLPGENSWVFPMLQSVTIRVNASRKPSLAPISRVVAGPNLVAFYMQPVSMSAYTPSAPMDAAYALRQLCATATASSLGLSSLSIFPDSANDSEVYRDFFLQELQPLLPRLRYLSISHWSLSPRSMLMLSSTSIEHLAIQSRFAIDADSLERLSVLPVSEEGFDCLRTLELNHVPLEDCIHIISTPRLLNNVKALRVAAIPVTDLDEDDAGRYMALFNLIAGAPRLVRLVLVARQDDLDEPYRLTETMVRSLTTKPLEVLRLYNFALPLRVGFEYFHPSAWPSWQNLRQLSIIRQDLTPKDFVSFASCPNLTHLSANISVVLGRSYREAIPTPFRSQLTLGTRFHFKEEYRNSAETKQVVLRIAYIFLQLCPSGLHLEVDRRFRQGFARDERDARWANVVINQLRSLKLVNCPPVNLSQHT